MKIKDFNKFIKESRTGDVDSYLNDNLLANQKNEDKRSDDDDDYDFDPNEYEFEDDSTKDYGYYDDWYEDDIDYRSKRSSNPKFDTDDDDYDIEEDEDDIDAKETLHSLLRKMFRNAGLTDVRITSVKDKEIVIECHLPKKTNLRDVIKAFEVAQKLKRDILGQYDAEFDVWQSKDKGILIFEFFLDEDRKEDLLPF